MPSITCPTHFLMLGPNKCRAFDLDHCEACGCEAEGANPLTFSNTSRMKMLSLGSVEVKTSLPELGYCDALQQCVCNACFKE